MLALMFACTNTLADSTEDELEKKLPITFKIASNPQKAGVCIAANGTLGSQITDFSESATMINAVLWAVIEEKQGKVKVEIIMEIAKEWMNALNGDVDLTISQMKRHGCSKMNNEINTFLQQ
jgi:hypothetical protein